MNSFDLSAASAITSSLFVFDALILASFREVSKRPSKFCLPAALLVGLIGIIKFLIWSYPVKALWQDSAIIVFSLVLLCFFAILFLFLLSKDFLSTKSKAPFFLTAAMVMEPILMIRPNIFLVVAQALLLSFSGLFYVDQIFRTGAVSRFFKEGIVCFLILFILGFFLFVHLDSIQSRAFISKGFEAVRTYQQVLADTENRLFSDSKVLALDFTNMAEGNIPDERRLFLWAKMLRVSFVSVLNKTGHVVGSSNKRLLNQNLSNRKWFDTSLTGVTSSAIELDFPHYGSSPLLVISKPIISKGYEVTGILIIGTRLNDVVGDDFDRNGLFFMNEHNELIYGKPAYNQNISCPLISHMALQSQKRQDFQDSSFCVFDLDDNDQGCLCYNGNFFKLISLPLYGHKISISKVYSLEQILLSRFQISLAIFLSATVFLVLLHKFMKRRFYASRLHNEIEARKQAEKELKTLAAALDQAVESVIITDPKGVIIYVNPFFTRLTGYKSDEVIGKPMDFLVKEGEKGDFLSNIKRSVLEGKPWQGKMSTYAKDGREIPEECSIFPIKGEDGKIEGIVAIKKDLTREEELETLLLHAQKMESIGLLAGGVAHDFNNILAAIQINLDLISLYHYDPEKTKDYLDKIQFGVSRASDLVKQLLMFSRRQALHRDVVDLNKSITNLMKMMESTIGENITLTIQKEPELWQIVADPGMIDQIIMNLIVNAKDAMPKGGRLSISTANVEVKRDGERKKFVRLTISDTGKGMSDEVRRRIFDPFFTTKEMGRGTGLGLSVVFGIVKQHGGFIDVKSKEGKGTSFEIYFPAYFGSYKDTSHDYSKKRHARGHGEKILLVEDEDSVGMVIKEALLENSYKVRLCRNISEAKDALAHKGPFDLLLSDVVLPDGSGVELAKEVREKFPQTAILLMSGYVDKRIEHEDIRRLGCTFFHKPFKISQLLEAVSEILTKNQGENMAPKD